MLVYNVVKSKVEILLVFFLVFISFNFLTNGIEYSATQNLKDVHNKLFLWKLSTWLKIILKTLEKLY